MLIDALDEKQVEISDNYTHISTKATCMTEKYCRSIDKVMYSFWITRQRYE